jgi:hypothetical protein
MLKTVSSVANALGALNYKGTWNATTNTPTLASGVGTQGDYYVVSVAGATDLDGITNWGVGDWAAFNGSVWQRVEGGADGNFVNLTASGTATITGLSSLNGGANVTGNVDATGRMRAAGGSDQGTQLNMWTTAGGDGSLAAYQLVFNTGPNDARVEGARFTPSGNLAFISGKGIDFSATAGAGTSELLDDYEEGTWTPNQGAGLTVTGAFSSTGLYTKVGRVVTITGSLSGAGDISLASPGIIFTNIPFAIVGSSSGAMNTSSLNGSGTLTIGSGTTVYGNTCPAVSTIYFALTYTAS